MQWSVVAERSSLPDSDLVLAAEMWVRIPARDTCVLAQDT